MPAPHISPCVPGDRIAAGARLDEREVWRFAPPGTDRYPGKRAIRGKEGFPIPPEPFPSGVRRHNNIHVSIHLTPNIDRPHTKLKTKIDT